jgi:hypothetical protein
MSQPVLSPNQFALTPFLGTVDQRYNYNTKTVEMDATLVAPVYAGQAVKIVDSVGGVPKVIAVTADADDVFGFINYDVKSKLYAKGDMAEISQAGNVIYLYATGAIARGAQVTLNAALVGYVAQKVASSGDDIVGWALDKATAADQLIRVQLTNPTFTKA